MHESTTIEADLRRIETGLRQLKVQYDMFFAGSLKREPVELRARIDRIIKSYTNSPIRKYAHRFHLGTLVSRYNSLSELWGKTTRAMERGDRRSAPAFDAQPGAEKLVARCRFRGSADDGGMKRLYDRFVRARESAGAQKRSISYDKFVAGIAAQTRNLQKEPGCGEIELRVVVADGKVQVKARADR